VSGSGAPVETAPDSVAYVVERFPELSQTFIMNELRELHRRGIRPRVFALYPPSAADSTADDLPFELLPSLSKDPLSAVGIVLRILVTHPLRLLHGLALLARGPSRLRVHAFGKALFLHARLGEGQTRLHAHFARASASAALYAALIGDHTFSFTAHGSDVFMRPLDLDYKLRHADVAVTVCQYNRRFIEKRWPGLGRVEVVPCGVDTGYFAEEELPAGTFRILAVGRLVPQKGFADLVRACGVLHDQGVEFACRIIGDGPLRDQLSGLIADLGLAGKVELTGPAPAEAVRAALEWTTCLCLPAVIGPDGERDSQPVVVKEAMATGRPVVVTHEVGLPEIVDSSVGRLVDPGRPDLLAEALAELAAAPPGALGAMGHAGRLRVESELSLAKQVDRLLGCWRETPSPHL